MIDQPPPPAHVRMAEAEKKIEEALSDQACRKKLKQAATKIVKIDHDLPSAPST